MLYLFLYSRHKIGPVILIGSGVVIGYSPIIIYDLFNGFVNLGGLIRLPSLHAVDEPRIFHFAKTLWNFENVLSGQALWVSKLSDFPYLPALVDWGQGLLFTGLFLLALAVVVMENGQDKSLKQALKFSHRDGLLLLFIILPLAYLFLSRSLIQRHYFLFFYPAPFLILARGLALWQNWVAGKQRFKGLTFAAPLALSAACLLNLITVIYGYNFLVRSGGEGQYGTILADKQSAVEFILAHSQGNYKVNVETVQETLPYVFLFEAADDIVVEGREDIATSISSSTAGDQHQYRLVEPSYHAASVGHGEKILYQARGVTVIGQVVR
jgi:hypothetical protein